MKNPSWEVPQNLEKWPFSAKNRLFRLANLHSRAPLIATFDTIGPSKGFSRKKLSRPHFSCSFSWPKLRPKFARFSRPEKIRKIHTFRGIPVHSKNVKFGVFGEGAIFDHFLTPFFAPPSHFLRLSHQHKTCIGPNRQFLADEGVHSPLPENGLQKGVQKRAQNRPNRPFWGSNLGFFCTTTQKVPRLFRCFLGTLSI